MGEYLVRLDKSACSGMGDCVRADPSAFEMGDDGIASQLVESSDSEQVIAAAQHCPMAAISIFRADSGEQIV